VTRIVDPAVALVHDTAVVIGSDGLPFIAYAAPGGIRVAHCDDAACTSGGWLPIGPGDSVDVAIGSDGLPILVLSHGFASWVVHCDDPACASSTTTSAPDVAGQPAIVLGAEGKALIASRTSNTVKVTRCQDVPCTTMTTGIVYSDAGLTTVPTLAMTAGATGRAQIAFNDNLELRVLTCTDDACTSAVRQTPVSGLAGSDPEIVTGTDGLPFLVFRSGELNSSRSVHCANRFCLPHVRYR
jgi:hypothetical protein